MKYYVYNKGKKNKVNSSNTSVAGKQEYAALIIKFRGGLSKAAKDFNRQNGLIRKKDIRKEEHIYICYFKKMSVAKLAALAKIYYQTGVAEFAEPYRLHGIRNADFNDPLFNTQWIFKNDGQQGGNAGEDIGIVDGLQLIRDSNIQLQKDICVAVLDEGVDTAHPDFANAGLWHSNFNMIGNNFTDPKPKRHDNHGTQVAGVIAAIQDNSVGVAGINPFCKIMAGRIYYTFDGPFADPVNIEWGIRNAVDQGARVINLSWRLEFSQLVASAIEYGFSKNVVFCAAAGNYFDSRNTNVTFPGNMDEVITVGACNNRGEWVNLVNSPVNDKFGSCFGREVDILAPGVFIATTMNKANYTNAFSGTSAATAIVSAIAALVLAVNPALGNIEVRDILLSTADLVNGESTVPYLERAGHGKINAKAAIQKAIDSLG
jgi:thermitase